MTDLRCSEVGVAAADAVRAITSRHLPTDQPAAYVEGDPVPWSSLAAGGWDTIGVGAQHGGGDATLVDLIAVARTWGEYCVPLPFMETVVARRWSEAARVAAGPLTVAAPDHRGGARAPLGGQPGVRVVRACGAGPDSEPLELEAPEVDRFAASLRLARTETATVFGPQARHEIAVVWAAEATGCADAALRRAVLYCREHQQFGRPIGSFQAVKHRLSDSKVLAEGAETAVIWAALDPVAADRAVRYALSSARRVIEHAIQVHGGMGFTWEVGLHHYARHVAILRELVVGLAAG